uniref:Uncharacterized protein n=1 Tax=Octopus bimaculoides TaxID=37653 RepID=A0A0L8GWZ7_OCTBM
MFWTLVSTSLLYTRVLAKFPMLFQLFKYYPSSTTSALYKILSMVIKSLAVPHFEEYGPFDRHSHTNVSLL